MSFLARFLCVPTVVVWLIATWSASLTQADVPFEGFLPMVGMALSDEYLTFDDSATHFISDPAFALGVGANLLGPGSSAHYELALFDTGAATHIITSTAAIGFNIDQQDVNQEAFDGTNFQTVGGATGLIDLRIEDPLGVYIAGLSNNNGTGGNLSLPDGALRGQTSFSILNAPSEWTLPNIVGMPMVAHHQIRIRNSSPQILNLGGRTVRTPDIQTDFLGSDSHNIQRRAPLKLSPGIGFIQGPIYITNFDLVTFEFHENPLSPSVIENGALFIETDLSNNGEALNDFDLFFDTGASLTVVSEQTAVRLGFDPILDTPEFVVQVEGSGGVSTGIPGFFLDELSIDTIGGGFVLNDVPVAVLDVADPSNPGNVVDGILGMNVFTGRDIVIDANPQIGQGGVGPSLYISDPVTESHAWGTTAPSDNWVSEPPDGNWSEDGVPNVLWDAVVANVRGSDQEAVLSTSSTIFRATISGGTGAEMSVRVAAGGTLEVFADVQIEPHGRLHLDGGHVDAQYITVDGGTLSGEGTIFVGSGPLTGAVRVEAGGRLAPGAVGGVPVGTIDITGDVSVGPGGALSFDLGGDAGTEYDQLNVDRFAFLGGELEVSLVDLGEGLFMPEIGDMFTIITADEEVQGTFDTFSLPAGFSWDIDYFSNSVRLEVTGLGLTGDFSGNGDLDCADINMLTSAVASNTTDMTFDLNGDGQMNLEDVTMWVEDIKGTLIADANLDGIVDTEIDFMAWNEHKFTASSNWCDGDFNADGFVDGRDFLIWNSNKGMSAAGQGANAVPEPSLGAWWLAFALIGACGRRGIRRLGGSPH